MTTDQWSLNDDPEEAARSAAIDSIVARFASSHKGVSFGLEIAYKGILSFLMERSKGGDREAEELYRDHWSAALADRGRVLAWLGDVSLERKSMDLTADSTRALKAQFELVQAGRAAQPWPGLIDLVWETYTAKVREGGKRLGE